MRTQKTPDYHALEHYLAIQVNRVVLLTFSEIEEIIESSLPFSAHNRDQWWSSSGHSHAQTWERSGYKAINRGTNRHLKRMEFERY